ncbi:hypothetical protein EZV62_023191 [Acer yangbiense]|uniref:UBR-type domain-containing protein n=1 Tax=Acer yangbiense TaxID=1000413 RepID=A0A5C7H1F9_9ROSI|nr:hypothetical protein EZV62_023191 [Acer yangbiense]
MAGDEMDNEGEQTISIEEYLNEVEEEELEADLVLGGDEGKECTYSKGYMKRQAIFSCLTCTPEGNAGVCTACSLSCHDGHEIVELWTKRNFSCDCGNSKFGEFFCKLLPSKDVENVQNSYNHNFKGVYCTCNLPYPDPNVEEQVEMIQCCMCEDWFHEEHLGLESSDEIPRDEEGEPRYEDFICKACSAVCSFLTLYPQTIWAAGVKCNGAANTNKDKDVMEDNPSACGSGKLENGTHSHISPTKDNVPADANSGSSSGAEYERTAKQKREEKLQQQEGAELTLLNKLGHVEKMEILNGIADMKDEFRTFLSSNNAISCIINSCMTTYVCFFYMVISLPKLWRLSTCKDFHPVKFFVQRGKDKLTTWNDTTREVENVSSEKIFYKFYYQFELTKYLNPVTHIQGTDITFGILDLTMVKQGRCESEDSSEKRRVGVVDVPVEEQSREEIGGDLGRD